MLNDVSKIVNKTSRLQSIQVENAGIIVHDIVKNETDLINLLKYGGLSNDSAYNLYFSKIKPIFFLEVAQILTENGITVEDLRNPSLENFLKFLAVESAIRDRFCQISNLEQIITIFDKNSSQKLSAELCEMDFTVFVPKMNGLFDKEAIEPALDKVLKNLTGYDMTIDQLMNISNILQKISANISPKSNIGSLVGNLGKIYGQDFGDYFRRFVCGAGENDTDDSLFLSKSNLERMRERFQGQRHHTAELPELRETNGSSMMFTAGVGPARVYVDPSHRAQSEADHLFKTPRKSIGEEVENQAKESKKVSFFPKKKRKRVFPKDSNNTRVVCNFILLDVLEETQCWDWLKSFEIPQSFLFQLFSILRGFILISPNIDPVERISRKLVDWMDNLRMLQKLLIDLDLNAESYQRVLYDSDLGRSVRVLHKIVHKINNVTHIFDNSTLNRLDTIASFFLNSSDPQAGLPILKSNLQTIIDLLACFRTNRILLMEDERTTEQLATCLMDFNQFFGAVTFQEGKVKSSLPKLTIYKIRLANYLTDTTTRILDKTWNPRPRDRPFMDLKYLYYGFSFLQDSVDKAIIEEQTNTTQRTGVYAQQFPNPCYSIDQFVKATARLLPLCMTLAWVLTFSLIIKNVVYEKELRLKEFMKVMGLGNFLHWAAWYIQTIVVVLVSIILFVTILKFGRIVQKADFTILTLFIVLYANASISQAFLISTLFNNANLAANCGGFIYFVLFLPYSISFPFMDTLKFGHKIAMNLLAQVAFGHGCMYMAIWEDEGEGLQWRNLHLSPDMNDNYNFLTPMLMLIFDAWLYGILTWYIENVFPGAYGIPRPWYFFLQKSYWCGEYHNDLVYVVEDNECWFLICLIDFCEKNDEFMEPPARNAHVGVAVKNLTKSYSNGKVAVDGLSVNFYENQITSFLGHNGAGKTTTISILTGLYPPTSGTVIVRGMDVRTHISKIRKSLGMCPQYNVLFDTLTVEEQLIFYGGLKGLTDQEIELEVEKMLVALNLISKRNVLAKFLSGKYRNRAKQIYTSFPPSGGMKRKLSIAVAFLGDSKIVVLDEPTAGVDPFARRQIWDLMVQCKTGKLSSLFRVQNPNFSSNRRTIIMSTHHMDEADLLGDRIAIIASGKLKCCGSSLFLKNLYGSGYYLTMVLDPSFRNSKARSSMTSIDLKENDGGGKRRVNSLTETTPSCTSSEETTLDEVDAQVPSASKKISKVKRSFSLTDLNRCQASLDKSRKLGIVSYGVSETKLEEIFLKVDPISDDTGNKSPAFYKKFAKFFGRISENCKRPKSGFQTPTPPADDATSDEEELHCDTPLSAYIHESQFMCLHFSKAQ
uniref:ABC transporter domain-containing protein n=1 Tax=Romanomermis culicivorax TaxID=13658 RepID=A0A915HR45_ROMCU